MKATVGTLLGTCILSFSLQNKVVIFSHDISLNLALLTIFVTFEVNIHNV